MLSVTVPDASPVHVLSELLDLSLLQRVPDPGQMRFKMLEPIRLYARQSTLVPEPGDPVHRAYAIHYLESVARADAQTAVSQEPGPLDSPP